MEVRFFWDFFLLIFDGGWEGQTGWWVRRVQCMNSINYFYLQKKSDHWTHLMKKWLHQDSLISFKTCFLVVFNTFTANYVFMSYMTFKKQTTAEETCCEEINVAWYLNVWKPCNLSRSFALRGTAVSSILSPHVEAKVSNQLPRAVFHTNTEVISISAIAV